MLYATAGCRLFIAEIQGGMPVAQWVEIGETEAFGALGGSWEMHDVTTLDSFQDGIPVREAVKGLMQPATMQIILANDPEDPGQALLWKAFRDPAAAYAFRMLWPNGGIERHWNAFVTAILEVYDTANAIVKLQVDLLPNSRIQRSEDS